MSSVWKYAGTFETNYHVIASNKRKNILFLIDKMRFKLYKHTFNDDFKRCRWKLYPFVCESIFSRSAWNCYGSQSAGAACYDDASNTIYFYHTRYDPRSFNENGNTVVNGVLIKLCADNDDNDQVEGQVIGGLNWMGRGATCCMLNKLFHIIGGNFNKAHLVYDESTKRMKVLHTFDFDMHHHGMVEIKSKIMCFGVGANKKGIREYDAKKNAWNVVDSTLPRALQSFGCTAVINDQYVVLFGGYDDSLPYNEELVSNDIWIYCVRNRTFTRSMIQCPKKTGNTTYHAVAMHDRKADKMCVSGFARDTWRVSKISKQLFPPEYLIDFMTAYYLREMVYLFGVNAELWRIDVFDIFSQGKHFTIV